MGAHAVAIVTPLLVHVQEGEMITSPDSGLKVTMSVPKFQLSYSLSLSW